MIKSMKTRYRTIVEAVCTYEEKEMFISGDIMPSSPDWSCIRAPSDVSTPFLAKRKWSFAPHNIDFAKTERPRPDYYLANRNLGTV